MSIDNRVSTGLPGLDDVIDMLRLGDNVVWQVDSTRDYIKVVKPYVKQAEEDGHRLVYFRFGNHQPLITGASVTYEIDASSGFESFATRIHEIIEREGRRVFYVFDCLSDLLEFWYSDLMIGNFFKVTCPFLFQLDTVAYFALTRGVHTHATVARIRETTQLLLDLYGARDKIYVHPLKAWGRYSLAMFFPHLIDGDKAESITASADAAALFTGPGLNRSQRDYWDLTLERAHKALSEEAEAQEQMKTLLTGLIIGREPRVAQLFNRYFTLGDILEIASREIGTGFIGGKSVGMLLGRRILKQDAWETLQNHWEPHDSFYLGSDVFYTYIVQNGWWELHTKQKTPEGYFTLAGELREKLLRGRFPDMIREQFFQMLEHYGQSPIIVRSSSLLEDNFGNAFAGKYESVFCANQGSPEDRFQAFEQAVRTVYASSMGIDALSYRQSRGLAGMDEQMAILVQRVSGDHYNNLFFPHVAGVGYSSSLYVWNREMDPTAGMLRLVFGLGTRAVDRVPGDYARLVSLDRPDKSPPVSHGDEMKFSQHTADVIDLRENRLSEETKDILWDYDLKTDKDMFFSVDYTTLGRLRESGRYSGPVPRILDFDKMLTETDLTRVFRKIFGALESAYEYPVDIEFTVNFSPDGDFRFNLLQCRPLQTKVLGAAVSIPKLSDCDILFSSTGNFMGGNVRLPLDYVIYVKPREYLQLSERDKYKAACIIGALNERLCGKRVMLIGPGRWGTTTPSLGVPVHFSDLSNVSVLCEVSYSTAGLMPELSFGSHFFQDIVESGMFYAAIFDGNEDVIFRPGSILARENQLEIILPGEGGWTEVLHIAPTEGLTLYSDIMSQKLLCGTPAEQVRLH